MLKIGDFSKMSKLTVKALRFYEEEGILMPSYIDTSSNYRYYESSQLLDASRIISLKQIGLSINEIKKIIVHNEDLKLLLENRKLELEKTISDHYYQLSKINNLLKEKEMEEKIFEKVIPAYYVFYKEGKVKDYSELSDFIYNSGQECLKLNPGIKCVEPEYCYTNYLDGEYKETDISIRYSQAVIKTNTAFKESETIKFMDVPETKCICLYHKGSYSEISKSYSKILKHIDDNKLKINGYIRECYIDGIWNKESENDYLTEIQIPIE